MAERREIPSTNFPGQWVACDGTDVDGPGALWALRMATGAYGVTCPRPGTDRYDLYDDCLAGYEPDVKSAPVSTGGSRTPSEPMARVVLAAVFFDPYAEDRPGGGFASAA